MFDPDLPKEGGAERVNPHEAMPPFPRMVALIHGMKADTLM